MGDTEHDAKFIPKSHSQIRSRRVPLYSHPVQSNYNPDYLVDGDYDYGEAYDARNNQLFEKNDNGSSIYSSRRYSHNPNEQSEGFDRYTKRQKLKNSFSNCEFVPRSGNLLSYTDGNLSFDWNEQEKFLLLEVWGDKFLQLRRNSLRSEDWAMVAEKVSETLKIDRTDVQCKQMMDILKRKYKKERAKGASKWAYFRKMDMLMSQDSGGSTGFSLACGVDSGEYVFMDTDVYLDRANGNDEMRDSPGESEVEEEEEEGNACDGNEGVKGLRVLADSVQKFGKIYEKIESSKREQMLELGRMRIEFQRELELQKKQILERAEAEIAKIRADNDDEDEDSDDDGEFLEDISN